MVNQFVRFMQEEEGATAIEYGFVGSLDCRGHRRDGRYPWRNREHGIQQRQHRNQLIL